MIITIIYLVIIKTIPIIKINNNKKLIIIGLIIKINNNNNNIIIIKIYSPGCSNYYYNHYTLYMH